MPQHRVGIARVRRLWDSTRDGRWLTAERARTYALLLLAGYAALLGFLFVTATGPLDRLGRPLGTDFANVWTAGRLVLEGRPETAFDPDLHRPYEQSLLGMGEELFYGWHYPPMFLAVAALLALLPYKLALLAWLGATFALYVAAIRTILAGARLETSMVVLAAAAYPAVFANITHGHNGCLSAALFGGGLAVLKSRPLLAGVLLGLLAYKPQYGVLIPFALAVGGHWRVIGAAAATVLGTVLISIDLFGIDSWLAFIEHSGYTRQTILENGAAGWFKLQGVFPAVRMLGGGVALAYTAQAIVIEASIVFVIWLWRSEAPAPLKSAGLILATMLATPYAFNYDTVMLGAAIAFIAADGCERGFAAFEKTALAALWLTPLVSREVTALTLIPIATLANLAVLGLLAVKVRGATEPARRLAHV